MTTVINYSDRAIAVIGDTKAVKETLKALGGRWNGCLTDPESGQRIKGWVFSKKRLEPVTALVTRMNNGETIVDPPPAEAKPAVKVAKVGSSPFKHHPNGAVVKHAATSKPAVVKAPAKSKPQVILVDSTGRWNMAAMKLLLGFLPKRSVLPIVENVLVSPDGVTVTDLNTSFHWKGATGIPFPVAIPKQAWELKGETITGIKVDPENFGLEFTTDLPRVFRMNGENGNDFPKCVPIPGGSNQGWNLNAETQAGLKAALAFVSKDEDKASLCGVSWSTRTGQGYIAGTDAHTLYCKTVGAAPEGVIIPSKDVRNLLKLATACGETCFEFNDHNGWLVGSYAGGVFTYCFRLIDQNYPDFLNVIPMDNPLEFTVNRLAFIAQVEAATLSANKVMFHTINTCKLSETESDIWAWLNETVNMMNAVATIEKVHAMPKQGVTSSFTFGKNFGFLIGLLTAIQVPFKFVTPQQWQKGMQCLTKGDKNISKAAAQRLWSKVKVTHSIADSMLIAEYGRKFLWQ